MTLAAAELGGSRRQLFHRSPPTRVPRAGRRRRNIEEQENADDHE